MTATRKPGRPVLPPRRPSAVAALRQFEEAHQRATTHAAEVRWLRDDAVRAALSDGWTHAQIAEATGLSRGRIGQIGRGA